MLRRIFFTLVFLGSSLFVASTLTLQPAYAQVTPKDAVEQGACDAAGQTNCDDNVSTNRINNTITQVINILSLIVGIVAVIMLIIGGFRYITSAGNPEAVKAARNTIIYAIIGLIIVAFAQIIARFVLRHATTKAGSSSQNSGSGSNNQTPSSGGRPLE